MRTRRIQRGAAALAAVVVAAGLLTACSDDEPPADEAAAASATISTTGLNAFEQQRSDGVSALLEQLSSTLHTGDHEGLDALIDAAAPADFRDRMHTVAAAFADRESRDHRGGRLRLTTFSYRVAPTTDPEQQLSSDIASKLEESGSSDSWVTPVELSYALGGASLPGLHEPPVTLTETMAFARYGDDWKVLGDASVAESVSVDHDPVEIGPWEFDGLAATDVKTADGTSTVLSYPGTEKTVDRVRKILPGAVDAVDHFWGRDWPRRVAVVATADPAEFAALTRTKAGDTDSAAAATVFSQIDRRGGKVVGQRIVLSPGAADVTEAALRVVVEHEMLHVAARMATAENAPMWLTEGVPEYVGRKGTYREFSDAAPDLAAAVVGRNVPKELPADDEFAVDSEQARVAYQSAWSFAAFVADEYDEQKLRQLYRAVAKNGERVAVDAAMKSTLGKDRAALVKQWQKWLEKRAR